MRINRQQSRVLIVCAVVVGCMLLYPPFQLVGVGWVKALGYSWIFDPPRFEGASVNVGLLLTQWLGVGIVGAILFVVLGQGNSAAPGTKLQSSGSAPIARHVLRWIILVVTFLVMSAVFAISGQLLKELGWGGGLTGFMRGAVFIGVLYAVWNATKRLVVAKNSRHEP